MKLADTFADLLDRLENADEDDYQRGQVDPKDIRTLIHTFRKVAGWAGVDIADLDELL